MGMKRTAWNQLHYGKGTVWTAEDFALDYCPGLLWLVELADGSEALIAAGVEGV